VKITSNYWLDVNQVVLAIYGDWYMPKYQLLAGQESPKLCDLYDEEKNLLSDLHDLL